MTVVYKRICRVTPGTIPSFMHTGWYDNEPFDPEKKEKLRQKKKHNETCAKNRRLRKLKKKNKR